MAASETSRVFFIAGVCSGFGRAIAEATLAAGHRVVGTLHKRVLLAPVAAPNPPVHLLPGSGALRLAGKKPAALRAEIDAWKPLTLSTDFD